MNILKRNLEQDRLNPYKAAVNDALDAIWKSPWLSQSMTKADRADLANLQDLAATIQNQSDVLLVLATGIEAKLVSALSEAMPRREGTPEIIVFGDTFSTKDYADLFAKLEGRDFSILAISEGEESIPLRGAYVCLKRHLVGKYGAAKAVERLYVIAGKESQMIAKDAAENEIIMLPYPQDMTAAYGANSNVAKLILAVRGADVESYLNGFYEMLASPIWDLDGADYSVACAICSKNGNQEKLYIWQKELLAFGKLQETIAARSERKTVFLPEESHQADGTGLAVQLIFEKGEEDLMMPFFEGCNPDGSLNLLLRDTAEKYFWENHAEQQKVQMSVESLDSNTLGRIFAFFQLSGEITEYLLNN